VNKPRAPKVEEIGYDFCSETLRCTTSLKETPEGGRPLKHVSIEFGAVKHDSKKLTSIDILSDHVLNGTLVGNRHILLRDGSAAIVEALGLIHSKRKCVPFPPKHIIGVCSKPAITLKTPDERVRVA